MTLPFALPDWLPWWVPIVVLVPALLWLLAFLFVPFSVLGIKSRLDVIEARLDEIQGEIRSLALRLPEAGGRGGYDLRGYDEMYAAPPRPVPHAEADPPADRPPIPPPPTDWYERPPSIDSSGLAARRARLDRDTGEWPEGQPEEQLDGRAEKRPEERSEGRLERRSEGARPDGRPPERLDRRQASGRRAEPRLDWPER